MVHGRRNERREVVSVIDEARRGRVLRYVWLFPGRGGMNSTRRVPGCPGVLVRFAEVAPWPRMALGVFIFEDEAGLAQGEFEVLNSDERCHGSAAKWVVRPVQKDQ